MAGTEGFLRESIKRINIPCGITLFKLHVHKHYYIRLFTKLLVLSISPLSLSTYGTLYSSAKSPLMLSPFPPP